MGKHTSYPRFGVRDLLFHLLYVCEREQLKPPNQTSVNQMMVVALSYCYYSGYDFQYDYMFEKSSYGATSHRLIEREHRGYNRDLLLVYARKLDFLAKDENFDSRMVQLLQKENEDGWETVSRILLGSKPYVRQAKLIESIRLKNEWGAPYPHWTKSDIVEIFSPDEAKKVNNKIPLDRAQFRIAGLLSEMHKTDCISLSENQLLIYRHMPDHLLEAIKLHGYYHNSELDKGNA